MAEVRNFTNNYRAKLSQNNRQWISLKITNRQKGFYVNLLERGPLLFPTTKHLFHFLILFFSFDFCFKISLVYLKKNYFNILITFLYVSKIYFGFFYNASSYDDFAVTLSIGTIIFSLENFLYLDLSLSKCLKFHCFSSIKRENITEAHGKECRNLYQEVRGPLKKCWSASHCNLKMERYRILKELGDGTCGNVYKAINTETSEIVAVKKMKRKFYFWEECINLREIKSLRKLNHPNIIKLKEIVRENNELFFILEYMECNLYQLMKDRQRPFLEEEIRGLMSQVLQGLANMHKNGYFHRDLKPENLLVTNDVIKIADFGLAREVSSSPPFTDYVSTRWYRAPEVLLQSSSYTPAIDMWAVGAVLAELFTLCPIFPGESEIDQLYKICCVLGPPDWTNFPELRSASRLFDISCFDITPANLSDVIPNASLEAIDLIKQLCSWDPLRRPTADQCLQHPFFHVDMSIPRPLEDPLQMNLSSVGPEPNLELNLWDFGTEKDDCYLGLTLAVNPTPSCLDLFPAKMASKSQGAGTDMFCPGFQDHSQHSVFWSLFPTDHHQISTPVDSSLSLSFSTIPQSTIGAPQSTSFGMTSLQTNFLERPFLAMSSSFQQGRCL